MPKVKFVYFDIGGVLFNWISALDNLAKHLNRPYNEVFAIFQKYDDDVSRGKISPDHLWEYYKKELNSDVEMGDFLDWWSDNFTPIPIMHEFVKKVSRKYKVGILTNIYNGAFIKYLAKGYVPDISYSTIIQSCELNLVKPEKDFFLHAQEKAGVGPGEILFIDDSKDNVENAKRLGWQAIWFDENNPQQTIKQARDLLLL